MNGDKFEAAADAPGGALLDVAAVATDTTKNDGQKAMAVGDFLDGVLMPESAALFAERFRDPSNPITLEQAVEVLKWLVEEVYASARPTGRPVRSPNGPSRIGPNTTAIASTEESVPSPSPVPTS